MKSKKNMLFAVLVLSMLGLQGCSQKKSEDMIEVATLEKSDPDARIRTSIEASAEFSNDLFAPSPLATPTTAADYFASKATENKHDGNKKFVRTASFQFSVADVVKATHVIEDIIIAKQGFIIQSTLNNQLVSNAETRVSEDSVLVQSTVRLTGRLTLRVHQSLLDATLREIAPLARMVQSRDVNAEEMTFVLMAKKLEQERKKDKATRVKGISGAGKGHKLEDMLEAEEAIDLSRGEADAALVAEKELYDRIEYSTITIVIWQEPAVYTSMKPILKPAEEYKESFVTAVGDGIVAGWNGLLDVVVFLFYIWPLVLFVGGILLLIIYRRRKKENNV